MRACAARRAPRPAQRAPTRRPDPDAYQGEQRGGRRQGSAWQSAHLGWEARPHLCWKGGLGSPRHGGQPSPEGLPGGGGTKPAGLQQQGRHQRQPLPGGSEPRAPPTTLAPARWRLQQLCPPELPPRSSPGERTEPGIQWEGAGRTLRVGLMGLPGRHKPPAARPQGGRPGTTPRTVQGSEQSWASRGSQSQAGTCRPGPCIPPVGHPGPQQSSPQFCSISGEQALALQNQADVL